MSPAPKDYVDVAERIRQFKEQYPEGSLQTVYEPKIFVAGDKQFIAYCAAAYRTPDDTRPGMGWAWEPVPGPTPFTRDSELMNAETSAWGRAIVALGFATKHVASADEIRSRQDPPESAAGGSFKAPPATEKPATSGQFKQIQATLKLLQKAFPQAPGEGRTWEDVAKTHCIDVFIKDTVTDLSMAEANELNDWLEDQYRMLEQGLAVPFA